MTFESFAVKIFLAPGSNRTHIPKYTSQIFFSFENMNVKKYN